MSAHLEFYSIFVDDFELFFLLLILFHFFLTAILATYIQAKGDLATQIKALSQTSHKKCTTFRTEIKLIKKILDFSAQSKKIEKISFTQKKIFFLQLKIPLIFSHFADFSPYFLRAAIFFSLVRTWYSFETQRSTEAAKAIEQSSARKKNI